MQLQAGSEYDGSSSRIDTRTQTEGPSLYWYRLNTTRCQADTTSTGTWKATDTTSSRTSNESVRVIRQILLVVVLVLSHSLCESAIGGV
jgi:mevalonate kinase